jgi:hypothetical protein
VISLVDEAERKVAHTISGVVDSPCVTLSAAVAARATVAVVINVPRGIVFISHIAVHRHSLRGQ